MANPSKLRTGCRGLLAVLMISCLTTRASAQQYQTKPIDDKARLLAPIAQSCVKDPSRYATEKERFLEYFSKYHFPAMTRFRPDELAELGRLREDLFSRYLWAARDERLQRDLTELAFQELQPVGRSSKFHPAVRYNAILVLGRLDKQYAIETAANRRPPIPYEEATAELLLMVEYATQGKPVPPFLVVGALVGLERHAQYPEGLSRDAVPKMTAAVTKLATMDEPLPDVEPKVIEWVRIQAANVLARLGKSAPTPESVAALANMIGGASVPKMTLDGRCRVAALLASVKLEDTQVDGKAMSNALLKLAVAVAEDEAKEAKAFQEMNLRSGGFGGGMRGGAGGTGAKGSTNRVRMDPQSQTMELDVRILLARLGDLQRGLVAAKSIVPADKQSVFDTVIAAIRTALASAESKDIVDLVVADDVVKMANTIRSAVQPGAAPIESDEPGDVF